MNLFGAYSNNYQCNRRTENTAPSEKFKSEESVLHTTPERIDTPSRTVRPLVEHENAGFLPGYLANKIGKVVRLDLNIGNSAHDRTGILKSVGSGYLVIEQQKGFDTVCDLSYIALVTVINDIHNNGKMLTFPK